MDERFDLTRFLDAQNKLYVTALAEIENGKKQSHWMWFVFPQLKGLGHSATAAFYGIDGIEEAEAYFLHPILSRNLIEISAAVYDIKGKTAKQIFGSPDDLKLHSSMTLFAYLPDADPIFMKVIDKYFNGKQDDLTLKLLNK